MLRAGARARQPHRRRRRRRPRRRGRARPRSRAPSRAHPSTRSLPPGGHASRWRARRRSERSRSARRRAPRRAPSGRRSRRCASVPPASTSFTPRTLLPRAQSRHDEHRLHHRRPLRSRSTRHRRRTAPPRPYALTLFIAHSPRAAAAMTPYARSSRWRRSRRRPSLCASSPDGPSAQRGPRPRGRRQPAVPGAASVAGRLTGDVLRSSASAPAAPCLRLVGAARPFSWLRSCAACAIISTMFA